jgi:hypothetical protein
MIMTLAVAGAIVALPAKVNAEDFVVYSVYKALDLGNPGETPQKDYYVNMGSSHGLNLGSTLDVIRKMPTYDVANQKLYKDMTFIVGTLKVIHVESNAAIARLEKLAPPEKSPAMTPRAVMVGDFVRQP